MKNIYLLTALLGILCSCNMKHKEEKLHSLINLGDEEIKSVTPSKHTSSIFNSNAKVHHGIDISHFQGNVVEHIKNNGDLRFIICKATQGDYFIDPDFRINWREIKEKGLIRGTYHFYDCSADPIKQADHFTTTISDITSSDIAPILDIEQGSMTPSVSPQQMVKDIQTFLDVVEKTLDRKPILYTDYAFAQQYLKDPNLAKYDLWLAEYSGNEKPLIPTTWKEKGFKMWQKSDTYTAYSRQLDFDVYYGKLSDIVK